MGEKVIEEINSIPMKEILDRLGIKEVYGSLYEDGKITSGWKLNKRGNYVADFSKDRAKGGPFAFVKRYLNLTARETFIRFEREFGIKNDKQTKIKTKKKKEAVNGPLPHYFLK